MKTVLLLRDILLDSAVLWGDHRSSGNIHSADGTGNERVLSRGVR